MAEYENIIDLNKLGRFHDNLKDKGLPLNDWQANKEYKVGYIVIQDGKLYRCNTEHTSTTTFDDTKWSVVSSSGVPYYNSNISYKVDDQVVYDNSIYRCVTAHTSTSTFDDTKWEEISGRGISIWQVSTSYSVDDVVIYDDLIWRCITAHTSTSVFDVQKWVRISDGDSIVYSDLAIGTIIPYMGNTPPREFLACDGTVYNITSYTELAEYINEQFGSYDYFGGDGTTTFAVPDLRGEFLRGTGTNSHTNQGSGANVGVHQDATEFPYYGSGPNGVWATKNSTDNIIAKYDSSYKLNETGRGLQKSGSNYEWDKSSDNILTSRPTNTSVLYCIKYTNTTNTIVHSGMKYETLWEGEAGNLSGASSDIAINLSESLKRYQKFGVQVKCRYSSDNRYYYREFDVSSFMSWLSTSISNEQRFSISWGYANTDDFIDFRHTSTDVQLMFNCNNSIITKIIGISEGVQIPTGVQAARVTLWEGSIGSLSGSGNVSLNISDSVKNYDKLGFILTAGSSGQPRPHYKEIDTNQFDDLIGVTNSYINLSWGFYNYNDYVEFNSSSTYTILTGAYHDAILTKIIGIKYIQPDSYSTEEKLIGTWIDGKPLYQKTIVADTLINTSETDIFSLLDYNVDKLVCVDGILYTWDDNIAGIPRNGLASDTISIDWGVTPQKAFRIYLGSYYYNNHTNTCYITIKYTKTTT